MLETGSNTLVLPFLATNHITISLKKAAEQVAKKKKKQVLLPTRNVCVVNSKVCQWYECFPESIKLFYFVFFFASCLTVQTWWNVILYRDTSLLKWRWLPLSRLHFKCMFPNTIRVMAQCNSNIIQPGLTDVSSTLVLTISWHGICDKTLIALMMIKLSDATSPARVNAVRLGYLQNILFVVTN